jgi:lipid-A-disaccharide synthase
MPEVQPVIAASAAVPAHALRRRRRSAHGDGWSLLHHARAALVKSGTSTLQAALAGTPLVVTYRVHPLTFFMARRLVEVPHVGLVNLVAGERVAPELLQAMPRRSACRRAAAAAAGRGRARGALAGWPRARGAGAAGPSRARATAWPTWRRS